MRKNIGGILILGILIMACIGQTVKLWLGDMSSHNFFESEYTSYEGDILYPKEIWSNVNKRIYKIDENNDENSMSFKILYELYHEIRKEELRVENSPKISYEELLSFRTGIIYHYGTRLSLEEIIGQNIKTANNKSINSKVRALYVDLSDLNSGNGTQAYVYLIDELEQPNEEGQVLEVTYKLTINNTLKFNNKIIDHFKEVAGDPDIKTYQSSLLTVNDSERFEGNVFYPVINEASPITYSQLRLSPLVENAEDEGLEPYVNGVLTNSKSQTMTILEDGATFSDNLNLSVKYSNVGTLEFNKTLKGEPTKSTPVEKMVKVTHFIANSEAIPRSLKKGLYLREMITDEVTGETHYSFGYQYEGYDVVLSNVAKEQLNVTDFLELSIKGREIIRGKWLMLEVAPADVTNSSFYELSTSVDEAIGDIIMKVGVTIEEGLRLNDLECAYYVADVSKSIDLKWVGSYELTKINDTALEEVESSNEFTHEDIKE